MSRRRAPAPPPAPDPPAPPEAWGQQPSETPAAYRAFCVYRDLGPERSQAAAYRHRYGRTTAPPGWFKAWSARHAWVERSAAYDAHRERLARLERERVWAERAARVADTEWDTGQLLLERAREMMRYPLVEQTLDRDGTTVIVRPVRWRQGDARALAETATKLMRLATGQATDRTELSGPDGGPLELATPDLTGLSDDQLAQFRALLALARSARAGGERGSD